MSPRTSIDRARGLSVETGLRRTLGPVSLVLLGIGCIVGAGVYVMTGLAAARFAGPAVVLSFVIAAVACGLIALCYAELASVLPTAGASYSYAYACLGETAAWALGWMVMLEFGLAGALLAVGFSGYLGSLLHDLGIGLPSALSTSTFASLPGAHGLPRLVPTASINLVSLLALLCVAAILVRGVAQSVAVNTVLVAIKIGVLLAFVLVGIGHVQPANWTPFVPRSEGGFRFGVPGIFRAASMLFFAYLGFEAVATAASEARRPQCDVPIGILGALLGSTLLYVSVAVVMTGLVSFRALDVADPIALAVRSLGLPVFSVIIKTGALTGLASVLLVNTYAQSRICFAMSADGLLPRVFGRLHRRFDTPAAGTVLVALASGTAAALLPLSLLSDLVSIGTAFVFLIVAVSVMALRTARPELPRPFRVPLGGIVVRGVWIGIVPVLAIAACLTMMGPVLVDLVLHAIGGDRLPLLILLAYVATGAAVYLLYGRRHSHLRLAAAPN